MDLMIPLRDYQKECLDRILESMKFRKRHLISIPTGGGKTIVFCSLALTRKLRTLVIAHTEELLFQAADRYVAIGGSHRDVGIIKADRWEEKPFTVASVQSLARHTERLNPLAFDLVVVDEAHRCAAESYLKVLDHLTKVNPDLHVLGVTATPFRSDRKDLRKIFPELVYSIDIRELMRLGYLVPVSGMVVPLNVNLDSVKLVRTENGERDFSSRGLAEVLNRQEVNREIVRAWLREASDRKTILYTATVEHAKELAREFREHGVKASAIDGKMPEEKRREIIQKFRNSELQVLTNVNILTEGFDDPETSCIAIVRPTTSLVLYSQMVGRGLRLAPEKKDCLILDFTGTSERHTIVGLPHLFGLGDKALKSYRKGTRITVGAQESKRERKIKVVIGEGKEEFSFEGKEAFEFSVKIGKTVILAATKNSTLVMKEVENNHFNIYLVEDEGRIQLLKARLDGSLAYEVLTAIWKKLMDEFIRSFRKKAIGQKPTEKQLSLLKRIKESGKIKREVNLEELNKFQASSLISFFMRFV